MPTLTIQIGNSDDKLTQREWAAFVRKVAEIVGAHSDEIHFSGGSSTEADWQNYCWVFTSESGDDLFSCLASAAKRFKQESIALTVGETNFIRPDGCTSRD